MRIHATAIAFGSRGVLIRGASGAGKSDLALRLLATPHEGFSALGIPPLAGTSLVSDDYVDLSFDGGTAMMSVPATIRGKFEVRGIGIIAVPSRDHVPLRLVVDLVDAAAIERMPEHRAVDIGGCLIPAIALVAHEPSAPIKVLLALTTFAV